MNAEPTRASRTDGTRVDTPVLLLVGGMGTRLQPVLPGKPKPLAPVGQAPFLQLLILQLRSQGIRRLVMCTGHFADQIETEFGSGDKWGVSIDYSKESSPLGTAGAVKHAERYLSHDSDFLVVNGDSYLEMDIREFIRFHREHGGLISIAVRRVPDAARYGTVQMDSVNRVVGFAEKTGARVPGVINGGIYMFNRAILELIPPETGSLETDMFPRMLERGVFALEHEGIFIDIGTPEDYARAQQLRDKLYQSALSEAQLGPDSRGSR